MIYFPFVGDLSCTRTISPTCWLGPVLCHFLLTTQLGLTSTVHQFQKCLVISWTNWEHSVFESLLSRISSLIGTISTQPIIEQFGVNTWRLPSNWNFLLIPTGLLLQRLAASNRIVWNSIGESLKSPTANLINLLRTLIHLSHLPCLHGESARLVSHVKLNFPTVYIKGSFIYDHHNNSLSAALSSWLQGSEVIFLGQPQINKKCFSIKMTASVL